LTVDSADSERFVPEAFFAHAAECLARPVAGEAADDYGLNPSMSAFASYRDAAVLVPVLDRSPLTMLFTLRTPRLSTHAGQVSFPGGKIDATDANPAAAALREAWEEVGLDPNAVQIVGTLAPYRTGTGFRIVPVLGRVQPPQAFRINHDEVAEIFEVPVAALLAPGALKRTSRTFGERERYFYEGTFAGHVIWGATAGIIVGLARLLYG